MARTLFVAGDTSANTNTFGQTVYRPISGASGRSTLENLSYIPIRAAGTLSGLSVNIDANTIDGSTTIRVRKNQANGNQSIVVGSTTTGEFQDLVNTESISVGNEINYSFVSGGTTGTINPHTITTTFDTTTPTTLTVTRLMMIGIGGQTGYTTASTTWYKSITGWFESVSSTPTEAVAQAKVQIAGTYKNLACRLNSNSRTTTTTIRLRKNTANGNQSIAFGSTVSGYLEDITNTDTVAVNDLVCYSITNGTGTSAITHDYIGVEFHTTTNPGNGQIFAMNPSSTLAALARATTYYQQIGGSFAPVSSQTEAVNQIITSDAWKFKSLQVNVTANGITVNASTVTLRVNGVDSALTVSLTAATTGWFQDTTHTVTVAVGDLINYKIVTGTGSGSQTIALKAIGMYTEMTGGPTKSVTVSDSVTLTSTHVRLEGINRTTSESLTLADSNVRLRYKPRTSSDSVTLSDANVDVRGKPTTSSDSLTVSHSTPTKLTTRIRTISDSLTLASTHAILRGLARTLSAIQSLTLASAHTVLRNKIRSLADSLTLTDSGFSKVKGKTGTIADSLTLASSHVILRGLAKSLSDSITLTSTHIRLSGLTRTLSATLTLASTHVRLRNKTRTISNSLTLTDSHTKLTGRLRTLAHSITLTDQLTRGSEKIASLSHSITLTDSLTKLTTRLRTLSDSLVLSSSLARLISKQRALSTSLTISGTAQQLKGGFSRFLNHTLTLTSTLAKQTTRIRTLSETLGLTDTFIRLINIVRGLPAQGFVLSDTVERIKGKFRLLDETGPTFSSSLDKITTRTRFIIEGLTIAVSHNRITSRIRTLTESKTFTDTVSFIKGGVGIGVLPTTAFIKHLTNKFIFKK